MTQHRNAAREGVFICRYLILSVAMIEFFELFAHLRGQMANGVEFPLRLRVLSEQCERA